MHPKGNKSISNSQPELINREVNIYGFYEQLNPDALRLTP